MRITIVGAGYVGLVTGACLAETGHEVVIVDRDAERIGGLKIGRMPIYEAGLERLVSNTAGAGRLSFTTDLAPAVADADAVFICVGTPPRPADGHADISGVHAVAGEIATALCAFTLVVTKSTVPVGTGDEVEAIIRARRPDADFAVVSNPEFLREGVAIADFLAPDRIVVGVEEERAGALMAALYAPLTAKGAPLVVTNRRTAELIKYAANSFLALKITYINEIANLCEEVGADVVDVSRGIGLDSRIGAKFLKAGPGFGGSCFPKDMLALMKTAQDHGVPLRSVETAVAVNDARKGEMVRKIVRAAGGSVAGKTLAVLGLTFKPDTDDMRSAASLVILPRLIKAGAVIRAYDPAGMANAAPLLPDVAMATSAFSACEGADAAVLITEWDEFARLDLSQLAGVMKTPLLIDLRNLFDPAIAARAGLRYVSIGRGDDAAGLPPAGFETAARSPRRLALS
ncbi:UDP-glucose dehydrogenase family protein [Phreatobacter sp. AB_2022a]|uniref:UDP-glucose dehydrogenase family protein n=1 Tax=Phreatobacter sp. AB_2022a TaxID=3003134 RepID=UPI0022871825|nr:UDP-glucose/GDP-mannose dehydrogenase family protein [Phreatobacter sp. AB_2022a]MCZ0735305.1 UDP-glucose/GDP-mannose dehydrogenase family protein [Phreatobacter sp. AB_2022a]